MCEIFEKIVIDSDQIGEFTSRLADEIADHYGLYDSVTVLTVLKGAKNFSDALRGTGKFEDGKFSFFDIRAESYYDQTVSSGDVKIEMRVPGEALAGKAVLIIEDIYDTGRTLTAIIERLREAGAGDVRVCVMLKRLSEHQKPVDIEFVGAEIDSEAFVIGFGLDYKDDYRDLPYIAAVKKEYH